ncbi:hypothetical protein M0802_015071 [Mischocyttarus mexicanus]|nr:hypothetical protein M0802_015071 [Mischocyttarus mexicanus]
MESEFREKIKKLQRQIEQRTRNPPKPTDEVPTATPKSTATLLIPSPRPQSIDIPLETLQEKLLSPKEILERIPRFDDYNVSVHSFTGPCKTAASKLIKRTFAANKTLNHYIGDLSHLRQKPNENIVRYACRTRDLESALLDAVRNEHSCLRKG